MINSTNTKQQILTCKGYGINNYIIAINKIDI